ncbi:ASKHA domain-containing protein [Desulfitobacterium sp.]|uniref:ASKHA domain-containing protein n=1 Tax=Desulfitobacterium sp. TaxID=49981 RepID=UPI002B1EB57B|nr:ASKHA domain-containing protein [Desulfitobacterium sp.]MEA4901958.1 ASKHA domain-containing protein [Desulfitobacterium sp.]
MAKVTFLPANKSVEVPNGSTISQAAVAAGIAIESTCGGRGTCGKCKVQILSDAERSAGWVLACQYRVHEDLTVTLSESKDAYKRKTRLEQLNSIVLSPCIHKYLLQLSKPSVKDQIPDWERLVEALPDPNVCFNMQIARNLPKILRQSDFQVTAVLDGHTILAVEPGDTRSRCFGAAIDIGTTTMVVYLLDLNNGQVIDIGAVTNPQRVFGADVISRISYAAQGAEPLRQLQDRVIDGLNGIIAHLCQAQAIDSKEIYHAVVVGNTTMSHLFLGIDPTYLAPAPFIPVFRKAVEVEARELGLNILDTAPVVVLPNIAGYVGADTVGVMLSAKIDLLPGFTLALDIGTNGEMILAGQGRILTCSTAAGPAFEGAEIKHGMRAADGAIEGINITDDVQYVVIGDTKPHGICGSGLIDAIAEIAASGVINAAGRLAIRAKDCEKLPPLLQKRLRQTEQGGEFVIAWAQETETGEDIVLTQKDIRELQLAKGAISAGVEILMTEMGIQKEQLDRVLLAGAFGNYIKKESALRIGLLPPLPIEKISAIGNAAGDGAKMALLSTEERERASVLADRAEHLELSARMDFQEQFIKALSFPR